ncbi:hypothetical protein SEEN4881_02276, partial [Salmonella enterica subsp. enterica serovar Newport str. WA_14881]
MLTEQWRCCYVLKPGEVVKYDEKNENRAGAGIWRSERMGLILGSSSPQATGIDIDIVAGCSIGSL